MGKRRTLAVATATLCASFAFIGSVGAATPKPGTHSWTKDDEPVDEAVDVTVNDNRKTFDFVRVLVTCGPQDEIYFITLQDPKGKDEKIKKSGEFVVKNKVAALSDSSMTKKFTLVGKFVKPRSAPFRLKVEGCGKNRLGELRQPNVAAR